MADTLHLCTDLYDAKSNFLQQQQQKKQRRQDNNNGNVRVHVSCPSSRPVLYCTVLSCPVLFASSCVRARACVCVGVQFHICASVDSANLVCVRQNGKLSNGLRLCHALMKQLKTCPARALFAVHLVSDAMLLLRVFNKFKFYFSLKLFLHLVAT